MQTGLVSFSSRKHCYLLAIIAIFVLFSALADRAHGQAMELLKAGVESGEANFVLSERYDDRNPQFFVPVRDPGEFFSEENLKGFYANVAGKLILKVLSPSDTESGEVRIYVPISYDSPQKFKNAQKIEGDRLSHCVTVEQETACFYEYTEARNDIPIEKGRVIKILAANDRLIMTTSLGNIVICDIVGNYDGVRTELRLAEVPHPHTNVLLAQNLTRIYLGQDLDDVVPGLNGELNGKRFGSKLISFNGNEITTSATRRYFKTIQENWDNPYFRTFTADLQWGTKEYNHGNILVDLLPVQEGILSKTWVTNKSERLYLNVFTLDDVDPINADGLD